MNGRKRIGAFVLVVFSCVLLMSSVAEAQEEKDKSQFNLAPARDLRLTLTTDKVTYRVNDEIRLTTTLENVSQDGFYIDPDLALNVSVSHGMALDVQSFDEDGNEVFHYLLAADSFLFEFPDSIIDEIKRSFLVLRAGRFYGTSAVRTSEEYQMLQKPGRYRLVATYSSVLFDMLTEKQRKRLSSLPHPLWSGEEIQSEPVWIEVVE
ncbi:MAG: hypothetical protein ACRD5I_12085 [Candidatus Acidiferrales bacterium]